MVSPLIVLGSKVVDASLVVVSTTVVVASFIVEGPKLVDKTGEESVTEIVG